jgi:isocitrate dehydrogenase
MQTKIAPEKEAPAPEKKELVGVDVFIQSNQSVNDLQEQLKGLTNGNLNLRMIGNRGVKAWPNPLPETHTIDQWRCRFMHSEKGSTIDPQQTIGLLQSLADANVDFIKTENLYTFDDKPGYTVAQDEQ